MSDSVRPHRRQPTRLPHVWDSPGKNTRVGCHFLLQCMKVKRESEVAQSSPTLRDPMDCSLPGSSIHGILQARVLEWGAIAFSATYSTGNQTQYSVIIYRGKEYENNVHIYMYIHLNHFAVHMTLTQHCKSIMLLQVKRRGKQIAWAQ